MENNNELYNYILNHLVVASEEKRKDILFEIVDYVAENETEENYKTIWRSADRISEGFDDVEEINDLLDDLLEIRGESKIQLILQGKINMLKKLNEEAEERIAGSEDSELIGTKKLLENKIKELEEELKNI